MKSEVQSILINTYAFRKCH